MISHGKVLRAIQFISFETNSSKLCKRACKYLNVSREVQVTVIAQNKSLSIIENDYRLTLIFLLLHTNGTFFQRVFPLVL